MKKRKLIEKVQERGIELRFANEIFKDDFDVVLEAVKNDGHALSYASNRLKNNKKIVVEALKQNGYCLQYVSDKLKNDKDVVLVAIRNHVLSIEYASLEIQELLNNHRGIADVLESLINKEKFEKQLFKTKNTSKKKIKI